MGLNKINRETTCRISDYSLTIMNKGDVVFCNYIEPIGNIKESNIIDILLNQRAIDTKKEC